MKRKRTRPLHTFTDAQLLRMLAKVVDRFELDSGSMTRMLHALRREVPRELPYIWLRSARALRGAEMPRAELSRWLRAAADLSDIEDPDASE